jgi:ribosome recycling factor
MKELLKDIEKRMKDAVESFKVELTRLRTGRASLALLDGINVDYYGSPTPINQVASLSVPDPTTIVIAPWEPKILGEVERAILKSQLGLTPNNDGRVVRLNIPQLTEQRRKDLAKVAHDIAERTKNEIRQIRRDGNESFKKKEKAKEISEDQMHDGLAEVQKLTDAYGEKTDEALKHKQKEIMEV